MNVNCYLIFSIPVPCFSGRFHVVQYNSSSEEAPELAIYSTVRYIQDLGWRQHGAYTPTVGPKWDITSLRVLTSLLLCCHI